MAQAIYNNITLRFHNLSNEALADAIGNADLTIKAAEKTLADYKDELKRRGLASATGEHFTVTVTPQISTRLDTRLSGLSWVPTRLSSKLPRLRK